MSTMQTSTRTVALTAALLATLAFAVAARSQPQEEIPFPAGYRTWAHVKSVVVGPTSAAFATEGGIHHIYANERALEGYRAGTFPDGSIIVYDLLETKEAAGNLLEGAPRRFDVMMKDRRRFAANDGWGFASFRGGQRTGGTLSAERQRTCLDCHAKRRDHDFVQSAFRE
jgi:hypothetical protein